MIGNELAVTEAPTGQSPTERVFDKSIVISTGYRKGVSMPAKKKKVEVQEEERRGIYHYEPEEKELAIELFKRFRAQDGVTNNNDALELAKTELVKTQEEFESLSYQTLRNWMQKDLERKAIRVFYDEQQGKSVVDACEREGIKVADYDAWKAKRNKKKGEGDSDNTTSKQIQELRSQVAKLNSLLAERDKMIAEREGTISDLQKKLIKMEAKFELIQEGWTKG